MNKGTPNSTFKILIIVKNNDHKVKGCFKNYYLNHRYDKI